MSKDTALSSSTVDDISQGISSISTSDNSNICGSCTDNTTTEICANCGKEGGSLKSCAACKLVKYCSRDCQFAHRPQHKKECRKRAAELRDERLFEEPPPPEDCPICFQRLPFLGTGRRYKSCCGKVICGGCIHAMKKICPFCRTLTPRSDKVNIKQIYKLVDAGDAQAMNMLGSYYSDGVSGLRQDYAKALEHWHSSAELGCVESYNDIGNAYYLGRGVEVDKKKANHYFELATIKGSVDARRSLGALEQNAGNTERAIKHYIIAVGGGDNISMTYIKQLYSNGIATKENYTKALRAYQKYLDEVKSNQRDEAAAAYDRHRYL